MSKKRRKLKRRDSQSRAGAIPWVASGGLHALVAGSAPSLETLDEMTRVYQENIRKSPLWDEMVKEFGAEEAERLLKEFRVEIR